MSEQDNCNPDDGINWEDVDIFSLMGAAESGVPGAVSQLKKLEKELALPIIDTVSGKASNVEVHLDWIGE
jgi:hypothetical protein